MPPPPLTTIYKEINSTEISTDIYLPPPSPQHASSSSPHPHPHPHPVLINIHGGAFMLGHSGMVSMPQIDDCLARGWIVVVPDHRLCPGVDVLSGPVQDVRDLLAWVYAGHLDAFLHGHGHGKAQYQDQYQYQYRVDTERVMAFGTSSGGFLALSLGYDVPRAPAAILDFYGPVHFDHPFWGAPLPHVQALLPPGGFEPGFLERVYEEFPVPTRSGISLEGQGKRTSPTTGSSATTQTTSSQGQGDANRPDFSRPRDAFALTQIANGTVLSAIYPRGCGAGFDDIDPVAKVDGGFPPTFIVHGDADRMVPVDLSRRLFGVLKEKGVECGMVEVEGEDHTFAMGMEVGSRTWEVQRRGFDWLDAVIR
ncbi:uncharacterized protein BJX67DRAFT_196695 [Aspergillus lucknowensis]|uniref:Alpha/Beta hydrolase protein n=1 Tax=Aspergillus lucknowensis TaxID=176173 RepID=A0ABR4LK60_9EURO